MSELKPCPFCGGEADWYEVRPGYGYVSCCACDASIGVIDALPKQDAIDAWNTRAERTCHVVPHGYCIANGEKSSCRCWSCSECSYGWHISDYDRQYRYCPNCGAKVVEE